MYRPQSQDSTSTNAAPVAPPPPAPPAVGVVRVLAPEGHFPMWLVESLKPQIEIRVSSYLKGDQATAQLTAGGFELYLLPDRLIPEGMAQNRFQEWPKEVADEVPKPNAMYLHHPFDLKNQYAMPYGCTFYAIASHSDAFPKPLTSWKDLFHPENFQQAELPEDPDLIATLQLLSQGLIGKGKNLAPKAQSVPHTGEEQPLRVSTISALKRLQAKTPAWKIALPVEGSVIELYHLLLGSVSPETLTTAREFLKPLNAARLADENFFASTVKGVRAQQTLLGKDAVIYPGPDWLNKTIFVKPTARALPVTPS